MRAFTPITEGTAYMAYQRPGLAVDFFWIGDLEEPVLVCPLGYKEKPMFTFMITPTDLSKWVRYNREHRKMHGPLTVLLMFEFFCEKWIDAYNEVQPSVSSGSIY